MKVRERISCVLCPCTTFEVWRSHTCTVLRCTACGNETFVSDVVLPRERPKEVLP